MTTTQEKLHLLLQLSGKTQQVLAGELKVSFQSLNAWITGRSIPRRDALVRIDKLLQTYGITTNPNKTKIETISFKKKSLLDLAQSIKNPLKKILARPDLVDELSLQITYNSNAIEGSTLSVEDTAAVIFDGITFRNKTIDEHLAAKNHDKAFRFLLEYINQKKSIGTSLVKNIHKILMSGIRDDAGNYRYTPVRITGTFVPTANYLKVPDLMEKLFSYKKPNDILEFTSRFHADFEKIHPFGDGNGRTGRLILIGMLLKNNIAPAIIAKKKRPAYYKSLQKAQLEENYRPIEDFIIDAILDGYRIIRD